MCKYSDSPDETRLIIFGGMRKMSQTDIWCIVQVDHKEKSIEILEELDGKKIKNKKDGEFMSQAGSIEQNQYFINNNEEIYAVKYEYLHKFDKKEMKWSGVIVS